MDEDGEKPSSSLVESTSAVTDTVINADGNPVGKAAQLIKRLSRDVCSLS